MSEMSKCVSVFVRNFQSGSVLNCDVLQVVGEFHCPLSKSALTFMLARVMLRDLGGFVYECENFMPGAVVVAIPSMALRRSPIEVNFFELLYGMVDETRAEAKAVVRRCFNRALRFGYNEYYFNEGSAYAFHEYNAFVEELVNWLVWAPYSGSDGKLRSQNKLNYLWKIMFQLKGFCQWKLEMWYVPMRENILRLISRMENALGE